MYPPVHFVMEGVNTERQADIYFHNEQVLLDIIGLKGTSILMSNKTWKEHINEFSKIFKFEAEAFGQKVLLPLHVEYEKYRLLHPRLIELSNELHPPLTSPPELIHLPNGGIMRGLTTLNGLVFYVN